MVPRGAKKIQVGAILRELGVILLLLIGVSSAQVLDRVVASVNGEPILESELKVAKLFYGYSDTQKLLDKVIENHLIAQFLREKGMGVPESYLEQTVIEIAKNNHKSLSELYGDLRKQGLTPEDLKDFLRVHILATMGLRDFLIRSVKVSDIEIELERMKKGEIRYMKEIDLLVVSKDKKEELLSLIGSHGADLEEISKKLGVPLERLTVSKGDLVPAIDKEIWKVRRGNLAIGEDEENLYLAKVIRNVRVISGRSENEIKEEIVSRKIMKKKEEILTTLKGKSVVEIFG